MEVWAVGLFSVKRIHCLLQLSPWGALNEILPLTENMLNKPQLVLLSCLFYEAVPSSLSERLSCLPGLSVFWGHLVTQLFMNKSVLTLDHEWPLRSKEPLPRFGIVSGTVPRTGWTWGGGLTAANSEAQGQVESQL